MAQSIVPEFKFVVVADGVRYKVASSPKALKLWEDHYDRSIFDLLGSQARVDGLLRLVWLQLGLDGAYPNGIAEYDDWVGSVSSLEGEETDDNGNPASGT